MSSLRNFVSFTRNIVATSAFAALSSLSTTALSQTQLLDFTGGAFSSTSHNPRLLAGWEFSVSVPITVTDLGLLDLFNDGFDASHRVGLWDTAGTPLAQTTVASGMSGSTVIVSTSGFGAFRYNSIAPVMLSPGSYALAVAYNTVDADTDINHATSTTMASGSSFTQLRFDFGGFQLPSQTDATNGRFGPNLLFNYTPTSAVPEPGVTAFLVGMAVTGVGFMLSRRRRR